MFNATNSNGIISKTKNICWIFFCISGIYIKFGIFGKKRWVSEVICFWNYRLQKAGLLKCLKSLVSEHLRKVNMLKGPKDCPNLHDSFFVIFFWTVWKKISSKISVLVLSEILTLFVNILTPGEKYCLSGKAKV